MFRHDVVLIAPDKATLHNALTAAVAAGNKGTRSRTLRWDDNATEALLRACAKSPEGFRQWNGNDGGKRKNSGMDMETSLAVAWWTDPLGRSHFRIAADRVYSAHKHVQNLFTPYTHRPPLWLVHPENLYLTGHEDDPRLHAMCRCGATGPPSSLLWMGNHCGPCHDRTEEGMTGFTLPGLPTRMLLESPDGACGGVGFTADGRAVVVHGFHASTPLVWDLSSGVVTRPTFAVRRVDSSAVAPAGNWVATHDGDNHVVLWSSATGKVVHTLELAGERQPLGEVLDLAFNPKGSLLAVLVPDRLELWDVATGARLRRFDASPSNWEPAQNLAFSPDGRQLVLAADNAVRLWRLDDYEEEWIEDPNFTSIDSIAFSADGKRLVLGSQYAGNILFWDIRSKRVLASIALELRTAFAFAPEGDVLAVGNDEGELQLYSAVDGGTLGWYGWHTAAINSVAFSPDGRLIATASSDGFVKLWPFRLMVPGIARK